VAAARDGVALRLRGALDRDRRLLVPGESPSGTPRTEDRVLNVFWRDFGPDVILLVIVFAFPLAAILVFAPIYHAWHRRKGR
jgi:hypothetical protein